MKSNKARMGELPSNDQFDRKFTALAGFAFDVQFTVHQIDQVTGNGKSKPCTLLRQPVVRTPEFRTKFGKLVRRHPYTRVLNTDPDLSVLATHIYRDLTTVGAVFVGIAQEIQQDLRQAFHIRL